MEQKLLSAVSGRQKHLREALSVLASFYKAIDRSEDCETCLDRVVELTEEPNAKSGLLLQLGVAAERRQDWNAGVRYYERSLAAEPTGPDLAYFSHNNLAYCLNHLGNWRQAEVYCRSAIRLNPHQHNAHKNLGLALQGQERFIEAAHSFLVATERQPKDGRALEHLRLMIRDHPDAFLEAPEMLARVRAFWQAATPDQNLN